MLLSEFPESTRTQLQIHRTSAMPHFFPPNRELTIEESSGSPAPSRGRGSPLDRRIRDIAPLDRARSTDMPAFSTIRNISDALATTRAGACLTAQRFAAQAPDTLVAPEPYRAFVAVARALFPSALRPSSLFGTTGRSSDARIHPCARLEANVTVDPLAVIGPDAEIGAGTLIGPGAAIGPSPSAATAPSAQAPRSYMR